MGWSVLAGGHGLVCCEGRSVTYVQFLRGQLHLFQWLGYCRVLKSCWERPDFQQEVLMPSRTATIAAESGLHARPAAMFVQAATKSGLAVTIGRPGEEPVDARSILSVMGLGAKKGETVELTAEGEGADDVLANLCTALETPSA